MPRSLRLVGMGAYLHARLVLFDLAEIALDAVDTETASAVDELARRARAPPTARRSRALETATRGSTALCAGADVDTDALDRAAADLGRSGWNLHHARALVVAGRARVGTDNQLAIERWTDAAAGFAACDAEPAARRMPAAARPPRPARQTSPYRRPRVRAR